MVGTATPKQPLEEWNAAWNFSTGDELKIQWDTSTSKPGISFSLTNPTSESSVGGHFMYYLVQESFGFGGSIYFDVAGKASERSANAISSTEKSKRTEK